MEKWVWKLQLREGMRAEYMKRHDEIWPEMTALLDEAHICNYSIWNIGNELFGYYETDSTARAIRVQNESPVVQKWNLYMRDVLEDTPAASLTQVFEHR